MIRIEAPFGNTQAILLLPDPILGDSESRDLQVNYRVTMDSTRYSYVKNPNQERLNYEFEDIGLGKLVEIQEFFELYIQEHLKIVDFRDDEWNVILNTFPIEFATDKKSTGAGASREESGNITLEFIGIKL